MRKNVLTGTNTPQLLGTSLDRSLVDFENKTSIWVWKVVLIWRIFCVQRRNGRAPFYRHSFWFSASGLLIVLRSYLPFLHSPCLLYSTGQTGFLFNHSPLWRYFGLSLLLVILFGLHSSSCFPCLRNEFKILFPLAFSDYLLCCGYVFVIYVLWFW